MSLLHCKLYFTEIHGAPNINLTAANEHEPFIEHRIRVIKERVRALRHTLPFQEVATKDDGTHGTL